MDGIFVNLVIPGFDVLLFGGSFLGTGVGSVIIFNIFLILQNVRYTNLRKIAGRRWMWTAEDRDGWRFMGDASTSSGRQKAEDNLIQVTFTNLRLATQGMLCSPLSALSIIRIGGKRSGAFRYFIG